MSDPSSYTYPSPLEPYKNATNLAPLTEDKDTDGKSLLNPQTGVLSESYERFVSPVDNGIRGGFDAHIYYFQANSDQKTFAKELHDRIRREFPELRIYKFFEVPVGPHPVAMFEVNLLSPAEFGAFVPWLVINRGPLSVLLHPNTINEHGEHAEQERDHTQRATWLGEKIALDLGMFKKIEAWEAAQKAEKEKAKAGANA